MPFLVSTSFDRFLEAVSLSGTHVATAAGRQQAIVQLLGDRFAILEAFPSGSLMRGTALKARSDVDVMVVLHYGRHCRDKSPKRVLEDVREHLSQYDARLSRKNGQAVTLYFKTWPNVDIVPAVRVTNNGAFSHYEIPDAARGVWIETNPKVHDAHVKTLWGRERQRIQMIKTWNEQHSGLLQSFHIEVLELLAPRVTLDWPWDIYRFFESALERMEGPLYYPARGGARVDAYLTPESRRDAKDRLKRALDWALDAWYAVYPPNTDDERAIERYRMIFGPRFPAYG